MRVTLKPNTFNNMIQIDLNDNIRIQGQVISVYDLAGKKYIDILLNKSGMDKIKKIEDEVCAVYGSNTPLISNVSNGVFQKLKIPTHYNHVAIPIRTRNDKNMLFEHLEPQTDIVCDIMCTHLFKPGDANCISLTWCVNNIIANITYID